MLAKMLNENQYDSSSLLTAISDGNEQAMEYFYNLHHGRILSYAKSRLHHYEDAIEIVNEVMLEVWLGKNEFKNKSKVSTWLFGITHHKIVDNIRKRQRQETIPATDIKIDDEIPALDAMLESDQEQAVIKRAMNSLNQDQKQVLYLAFYKGLSYSEVANILGCPEGTVKTRALHAKRKIRTELERASAWD